MRLSFQRIFNVFRLACWLVSVWITLGAATAWSQSSSGNNVINSSGELENFYDEYERRLNAILRTRRDEEKQFVAELVDKIEQDKIPVKLINTTFEWVRNKRPDTEYPFFYFERVLRLQAARLNLEEEIPPFDYSEIQVSNARPLGQPSTVGNPTEPPRTSFLNRFFRFPSWLKSD